MAPSDDAAAPDARRARPSGWRGRAGGRRVRVAALAERWWCLLPRPSPTTPIAADAPDPEWVWRPVVLVEVDPARTRIRIAMAAPEELTILVTLATPVGGLLRSSPPE